MCKKFFLFIFIFIFNITNIFSENFPICDSGDLLTTCIINSSKVIHTELNGSNLIFGSIANITSNNNSLNYLLDFSGNITFQSGSIVDGSYEFKGENIIFENNSFLTNDNLNDNRFILTGNLTLKDGASIISNLNVTADNILVESGALIDASGLGYFGGFKSKDGDGPGAGVGSSSGGTGGSYGGVGGLKEASFLYETKEYFLKYGSYSNPTDYGSGGGSGNRYWGSSLCAKGIEPCGGNGGGRILLNSLNLIKIYGNISANGLFAVGSAFSAGGGSGGTINIISNLTLVTGLLSVFGGNGYGSYGYISGAGAGGRISINSTIILFNGTIFSFGGIFGNTRDSFEKLKHNHGTAGTVYFSTIGQQICDVGNYTTTCYVNTNKNIFQDLNLNNLILNSSTLFSLGNKNLILNVTNNISLYDDSQIYFTGDIYAENMILNNSRFSGYILNISNILLSGDLNLTNSSIRSNLNLTSNNVYVDSNSVISADYLGYQGGSSNEDGYGPGGGVRFGSHGSGGSYGGVGGSNLLNKSLIYGDLLKPTYFGSGGGSGSYHIYYGKNNIPYSSGGGKLLFNVANNFNLNGNLQSNGYNGGISGTSSCGNLRSSGGGSGGSIFINTSNLIGYGVLSSDGGTSGFTDCSYLAGGGSGGRIAIYESLNSFNGKISIVGELNLYSINNIFRHGMPGTYTLNGNLEYCDFKYKNNICYLSTQRQIIENTTLNFNTFEINNGSLHGYPLEVLTLNIQNISLMGNSSIISNLNLSTDIINMDSNSKIDSSYLGYKGGNSNENGYGTGGGCFFCTSWYGGGAGYGGAGGKNETLFGITYGLESNPFEFGSGGSGGNSVEGYSSNMGGYGSGGGKIIIYSTIEANLAGSILSSGKLGLSSYDVHRVSGGGSGGSININSPLIYSSALIQANGGNSDLDDSAGSGGGGRIALFCTNPLSKIYNLINAIAGDALFPGEDGTFYNYQDICQIIPLIDYDMPTPEIGGTFSRDYFEVKVQSMSKIYNCIVHYNISGISNSTTMTQSSDLNDCLVTSDIAYINKKHNDILTYYVEYSLSSGGPKLLMDERTLVYYLSSKSLSVFPSFGLIGSFLLIILSLIYLSRVKI